MYDYNANAYPDPDEPTQTTNVDGYFHFREWIIGNTQVPRPFIYSPIEVSSSSRCIDSITQTQLQTSLRTQPKNANITDINVMSPMTTLTLAIEEVGSMDRGAASTITCRVYLQSDHRNADCNEGFACLGGDDSPNVDLCTNNGQVVELGVTTPLLLYLMSRQSINNNWLRHVYSNVALEMVVRAMTFAQVNCNMVQSVWPCGTARNPEHLSWMAYKIVAEYVLGDMSLPVAINTTALTWLFHRLASKIEIPIDPSDATTRAQSTAETAAASQEFLGVSSADQLDVITRSGGRPFAYEEHRISQLCKKLYPHAPCIVRVGCPRPEDSWYDPLANLHVCNATVYM
jgi:hypothetical protein